MSDPIAKVGPFFRTQWGVVQKIDGDRAELMPQLSFERIHAEGYRQWLIDRDAQVKEEADIQRQPNFGGRNSNDCLYMWEHGFGGRALKKASYHLVARQVSDWSEIDD